MNDYLLNVGKNAKKASQSLLNVSEEQLNKTLLTGAKLIRENKGYLQKANAIDIENAKLKGQSAGFIDRLTLSDKVIEGVAVGMEQVATLKSPVGSVSYSYQDDEQGFALQKKAVPFGVIGIIYESRPNVTADAFALCFKTSNAVILKGGSDSINSNKAMVTVLKKALEQNGIDQNAVSLIEDTSRETTVEFMKMNKYVDLLIPRGSASLINSALQNATVPIIETGTGNCHVYVDNTADVTKAVNIIFNAKTQRYSVCNACESLVIHSEILQKALPQIAKALEQKQVVIRADERAFDVIQDYPYLEKATDKDFFTEYGDAIISVKTVDSLSQAIDHINEHSTKHSECIVTETEKNAEMFLNEIDSACVYHNASTRFSDGFQFGLGAEIGISTQKLHARGPMGLGALVTYKYVVKGNGAVRK
ncbi:MAG: glutamate-5-semialdehyde dehydrogenase [Clostridia bacterium]|nr:glutamate-5-semialdehyde dehydrogenase [Clostridia bacterium]